MPDRCRIGAGWMKGEEKEMRSAKIFLAGMYTHLVLSIAAPICIVYRGRWESFTAGLFFFYLVMIAAVHVTGWVCAGMGVYAYQSGRYEQLRQGWKLLKLWSIPFYILNFLYSVLAWGALIGASRGLMLLFIPIPILITCSMIIQSGCVGICYIRYLRKQAPEETRTLCPSAAPSAVSSAVPSAFHYLLQLVAVADMISTWIVLRRYDP